MAISHPTVQLAYLAAVFTLCTPSSLHSQPTTAHPPAFDVVSIRPSQTVGPFSNTADGYYAMGRPLAYTILSAYVPLGHQSPDLLVNAPDWVLLDRYDFIGKVAAEDLPAWNQRSGEVYLIARNDKLQAILQPMLQAVLAERCKLAVHRIAAQVSGYALVLDKKGTTPTALAESKPDDEIPQDTMPLFDGGRMTPVSTSGKPIVTFYNTSMAALAALLPFGPQPPIVDHTGLTGKYDFSLTLADAESDPPNSFNLAAIGLKLVPTMVPVEKIVIDHIQKPTPN